MRVTGILLLIVVSAVIGAGPAPLSLAQIYQDLRSMSSTGHDPWIPELGPQVVRKQTVPQFIQRLAEFFRLDL
jgi:hypothetical protein